MDNDTMNITEEEFLEDIFELLPELRRVHDDIGHSGIAAWNLVTYAERALLSLFFIEDTMKFVEKMSSTPARHVRDFLAYHKQHGSVPKFRPKEG